MIAFLAGTRAGRMAMAAFAGIAFILTFGQIKKSEGANQALDDEQDRQDARAQDAGDRFFDEIEANRDRLPEDITRRIDKRTDRWRDQ